MEKPGIGRRNVVRSRPDAQCPGTREQIVVDVCLQNVPNALPGPLGRRKVHLNVATRINHGRLTRPRGADEVAGMADAFDEEPSEVHGRLPSRGWGMSAAKSDRGKCAHQQQRAVPRRIYRL